MCAGHTLTLWQYGGCCFLAFDRLDHCPFLLEKLEGSWAGICWALWYPCTCSMWKSRGYKHICVTTYNVNNNYSLLPDYILRVILETISYIYWNLCLGLIDSCVCWDCRTDSWVGVKKLIHIGCFFFLSCFFSNFIAKKFFFYS